MQLNCQEAELLFRMISERYEHGSVILTNNKYSSDWGELLSGIEWHSNSSTGHASD